jgi:heme oxygenase
MLMRTTSTLAQRLRHETADEHRRAEAAVGLPATVTSRSDYARLLARLISLHVDVETTLAAPKWSESWSGIGIVLADHERSHLLEDDLWALESAIPLLRATVPDGRFVSFGEQLGLLYVIEGSALGGILIGPMIRTTLGDVPTRFYDGDGRGHPRPWRSLQAALLDHDERSTDQDDVIRGARAAYSLVASHLASSTWSSLR